jgi:uncharacterized protein (UPF0548 family)
VKLTLTIPDDRTVREFLAKAERSSYSYPHVGMTREAARPPGYNVDHNRVELGRGPVTWEKAKEAIRSWKMFEHRLTQIFWPTKTLERDQTVAVVAHHLGFHSLNSCRIVYVIDEPRRFGFAYGTLMEHAETGEERFMVERDEAGVVSYDLFAFSRPRALLARLGGVYSRALQRQFAVESKAAMVKATRD